VLGSRFRLGVWLVSEDRDDAYDGSSKVDNPMQERTQIRVPLVTVDVRLTDRAGVQAAATVPNITRTAVVPRASGAINFEETFSGMGDTLLVSWYRLRPIRRWNVVMNAGASLPTGRTETPRFREELQDGSLVPMSRLQRGSGTFDPVFGLNVDRRVGLGTAFMSMAARTPVSENSDGLRTGASMEINGGAAHQLGHHRIIGFARLGWLHRQQDVFDGTPVLVGGGDWLYVTPGVAAQVGMGITAQVEVKLPVYRSLPNKQLDSSGILQFGFSRAF
jgi:hypothetical protein